MKLNKKRLLKLNHIHIQLCVYLLAKANSGMIKHQDYNKEITQRLINLQQRSKINHYLTKVLESRAIETNSLSHSFNHYILAEKKADQILLSIMLTAPELLPVVLRSMNLSLMIILKVIILVVTLHNPSQRVAFLQQA